VAVGPTDRLLDLPEQAEQHGLAVVGGDELHADGEPAIDRDRSRRRRVTTEAERREQATDLGQSRRTAERPRPAGTWPA
jgi:hypothetical protein